MPRERPGAPPLPQTWVDAPAGAEASPAEWWTQFSDPTLDQLVGEALARGPSVRIALLRVQEARAQSRTTITQCLPSLSARGGGNYSRSLNDSSIQQNPGAPGSGEVEQLVGAYGPQVSWEIPLFSRIEAAAVGARANVASARADARAAQVALTADIAQAYIDLRSAQNSRAALEELTASAEQLAGILDISARAGIASGAEAANARRLAETTRARIADLVIEARRAENAIAVLRGVAPGAEADDVRAALGEAREIPTLALSTAPAAPADLLRLRPDVARAEAQAYLAAAALADARTNFLPRLNLTGMVSVSDNIIGSALPQRTSTLTASPLITIPLFEWGALLAASRQRRLQFDESLIQYQQVVVQAVGEASNALAALDQGRRRLDAARAAEAAAERSAAGSRAAYGAGLQSLSDRLQADQQLIDARLGRIAAERAQSSAAVAVYRAFGGGPAFGGAAPR